MTNNAFKIVLPNMNAAADTEPVRSAAVTLQMQKILDYLKANGRITDSEISALLGTKKIRP